MVFNAANAVHIPAAEDMNPLRVTPSLLARTSTMASMSAPTRRCSALGGKGANSPLLTS